MRHVALIIETSRAYGRGLLNGVARYNFEKNNWWVHFQPYGLFEPVPQWFRKWSGDGILARIDNPQIAEAVMSHNVPVIDLRNMLEQNFPPFGASNFAVAEMAFEHFQERGIRNFAFYGEPQGTYRHDDQNVAPRFRSRLLPRDANATSTITPRTHKKPWIGTCELKDSEIGSKAYRNR